MSATPRWLQPDCMHGAQLLVIEPLFEEANRCRRLIARIMRALEAEGISACFAQLPGTGESLLEISDVRLSEWRDVVAAAPQPLVASFRGGSLIDDAGPDRPIWRFASETGERLVRDLRRTMLTGGDAALYAGHALSDEFVAELEAASPAEVATLRTVRLESDAAHADATVSGSPLWRRAEPGDDAALAGALAADLITWVKSCAAS